MELSYLNHKIRTGKPQSTVFMNFGIVSISDNWNIINTIEFSVAAAVIGVNVIYSYFQILNLFLPDHSAMSALVQAIFCWVNFY